MSEYVAWTFKFRTHNSKPRMWMMRSFLVYHLSFMSSLWFHLRLLIRESICISVCDQGDLHWAFCLWWMLFSFSKSLWFNYPIREWFHTSATSKSSFWIPQAMSKYFAWTFKFWTQNSKPRMFMLRSFFVYHLNLMSSVSGHLRLLVRGWSCISYCDLRNVHWAFCSLKLFSLLANPCGVIISFESGFPPPPSAIHNFDFVGDFLVRCLDAQIMNA